MTLSQILAHYDPIWVMFENQGHMSKSLQGQRKKRRLETAEMADCDAVKAENN